MTPQEIEILIDQMIEKMEFTESIMLEYQTPEGYLGYINEKYVDDRPKNTILTGNKKVM